MSVPFSPREGLGLAGMSCVVVSMTNISAGCVRLMLQRQGAVRLQVVLQELVAEGAVTVGDLIIDGNNNKRCVRLSQEEEPIKLLVSFTKPMKQRSRTSFLHRTHARCT